MECYEQHVYYYETSFYYIKGKLRGHYVTLKRCRWKEKDERLAASKYPPVYGRILTVFDEDTVLRFSRDVACARQFVHQGGYHHCNLGSPRVVLTENFKAKSAYDLAWQSLHMRLLLPAGVALLQEELVAVTTK
ncbi:unnamed protein product [Porites lobata]|uniref:Uncharacterized protein n=1 Tax=Porites lobata TaxID=104759 RepID=A0ABN8MYF6_9CNID|nr:unnamed protein product [Porites lobata]